MAPGPHGSLVQTTTMMVSGGKRTDGAQHQQWRRRSEFDLEPLRLNRSDQQHRPPVQAVA